MQTARFMKTLCAAAFALGLGLMAAPVRAENSADRVPIMAALVAVPVVVLTFEIGNIAYIAHGPSRSVGRQVFSWGGIVLGAAGIAVSVALFGGLETTADIATVFLLGGGVTAALGVWNLTLNRGPDPQRTRMLTPGLLADGAGRVAPGVLLGGRF